MYGVLFISFYDEATIFANPFVPTGSFVSTSAVVAFVDQQSFQTHTYFGEDQFVSSPWSASSGDAFANWEMSASGTFGVQNTFYELKGSTQPTCTASPGSYYLTGVDTAGMQRHFEGGTGFAIEGEFDVYYVSWHVKVSGWVVTPSGLYDTVEGYIWFDREWLLPATGPSISATVDPPTTYASGLSTQLKNAAIASASGSSPFSWTWSGVHYTNTTDGHVYFLMWYENRVDGTNVHVNGNVEIRRDDGKYDSILTYDVLMTVDDIWISPVTNVAYPVKLQVEFVGWATLYYTPWRNNQESVFVDSSNVWEGACTITTNQAHMTKAVGYLELSGFVPAPNVD